MYQCVVFFHTPPTGHLAHNPGLCPDWESNQQPCSSQASVQSTEHTSQGYYYYFENILYRVPHICSQLLSLCKVHFYYLKKQVYIIEMAFKNMIS